MSQTYTRNVQLANGEVRQINLKPKAVGTNRPQSGKVITSAAETTSSKPAAKSKD